MGKELRLKFKKIEGGGNSNIGFPVPRYEIPNIIRRMTKTLKLQISMLLPWKSDVPTH